MRFHVRRWDLDDEFSKEKPCANAFRTEAIYWGNNEPEQIWAIDFDSLSGLHNFIKSNGRSVIQDSGWKTTVGEQLLDLSIWLDGVPGPSH